MLQKVMKFWKLKFKIIPFIIASKRQNTKDNFNEISVRCIQ